MAKKLSQGWSEAHSKLLPTEGQYNFTMVAMVNNFTPKYIQITEKYMNCTENLLLSNKI